MSSVLRGSDGDEGKRNLRQHFDTKHGAKYATFWYWYQCYQVPAGLDFVL